MTETLRNKDEHIMRQLVILKQELEELVNDEYWTVTKEYYMGLLDGALMNVNKILKDMKI